MARRAQNSAYAGSALAHLAWVAWRRQHWAEAETQARSALELLSVTYQWRLWALWPLLGLALRRGQVEPAVEYARGILRREQTPMPDDLALALEGALESFAASDAATVLRRFRTAAELAQREGYL